MRVIWGLGGGKVKVLYKASMVMRNRCVDVGNAVK